MEQIEEMLSVARLNDLLKRPFSDNVRSSVETVLEAHFDPANRYETTGSLVEKEGRLNFDIVRPVYSTNLLSAIDKIVSGDDFTADEKMELSLSMETAREQVSRHYKERTKGSSDSFGKISNDANIMTRSIQLDVAQKIYQKIIQGEAVPEDRRRLAAKYLVEQVSKTENVILPEDAENFQVTHPGYLGGFHVHDNASHPSRADIAVNKTFHKPELVISAKNPNNFKLYLIHQGRYSLLPGWVPNRLLEWYRLWDFKNS